ncbi:MAG TPA: hypothetical protein VH496_14710 [Mycobacterium sp.]|jgi:hypothetical protein
MNTINTFAVAMCAGAARALPVASGIAPWQTHAASAHATAPAAARKRRDAATVAFVDRGTI